MDIRRRDEGGNSREENQIGRGEKGTEEPRRALLGRNQTRARRGEVGGRVSRTPVSEIDVRMI